MHASVHPLKLRAALCMRAAGCVTPDGEPGMLLALRDTTGLLHDGLTAQWLGTAAVAFLREHLQELVPGRCLDLEIYHIRAAGQELRARVKTCELAPLAPSWVKHAATQSTTPQEQHAS